MIKDITILCANQNSNYYYIKGLDIYDTKRNAFTYCGNNPVICHPPCAQFGRLRGLANYNREHLDLAYFCLDRLNNNGGILEHPYNSKLIQHTVKHFDVIHLKVYLSWFGFSCPKPTSLLFFKKALPVKFNTRIGSFFIDSNFDNLNSNTRSETPMLMCQYLVDCLRLYDYVKNDSGMIVNVDQEASVKNGPALKVKKDRGTFVKEYKQLSFAI